MLSGVVLEEMGRILKLVDLGGEILIINKENIDEWVGMKFFFMLDGFDRFMFV